MGAESVSGRFLLVWSVSFVSVAGREGEGDALAEAVPEGQEPELAGASPTLAKIFLAAFWEVLGPPFVVFVVFFGEIFCSRFFRLLLFAILRSTGVEPQSGKGSRGAGGQVRLQKRACFQGNVLREK